VSLQGLTRCSSLDYWLRGYERGSCRYIVPEPDSYGGAWDRKTGLQSAWDTKGAKSFLRGAQFLLTMSNRF